jgi:hypothetical protein
VTPLIGVEAQLHGGVHLVPVAADEAADEAFRLAVARDDLLLQIAEPAAVALLGLMKDVL